MSFLPQDFDSFAFHQMKLSLSIFATALFAASTADAAGNLVVGAAIADVTGATAQVGMMGYAKEGQNTAGLHFRQFARATVLIDTSVTCSCCAFCLLCDSAARKLPHRGRRPLPFHPCIPFGYVLRERERERQYIYIYLLYIYIYRERE